MPSLTPLASFTAPDGLYPRAALIRDSAGDLFGTTTQGGRGFGTLFEIVAGTQTVTTLASFDSANGSDPRGTLAEDANGNLFGTTFSGGAFGDGTVYELQAGSHTITALASFHSTNGANPEGGLVVDSAGNVFGTATQGGASGFGTVFEVQAQSGTITTLASFDDANGSFPDSGLIADNHGNLFGTTDSGGANEDGTVYEVAAGTGTITTLATFGPATGTSPFGGLVADASGDLFGTTLSGGSSSLGTVYEVQAGSHTVLTLASFNGTDGSGPRGSLVRDSAGDLFGTTFAGGASGLGTVFEVQAGANAITALASFHGTDGASAFAGPILDGSGNLFGTTSRGGASGYGTVYELRAGASTVTTLTSFAAPDGLDPTAVVLRDQAGNFFGTTTQGGAFGLGTVYEVHAGTHTITTLASFNSANGADPLGTLIEDSAGNLFGTTSQGGASGVGTVFEVQAGTNTFTTLASFNSANGANPEGGLVADSAGNFFGTTFNGGSSGDGTVYELQGGAITLLASFNFANGARPEGSLVVDSAGNLFGTASQGGSAGNGTVFEVQAGSRAITTLAPFTGANGASPDAGLVEDANGNLFGTTASDAGAGYGTVFEVQAGRHVATTLAGFQSANGADPEAGLIVDSAGNLFGTTAAGGAFGLGTLFEVQAGSGTITTLASFNGANGAKPLAGLLADGSGNFFGTASAGGAGGLGAVFELSADPPTISSVAADRSLVNEGDVTGFTLTVNGAYFASDATVLWSGTAVPTTFLSSSQLQAAIPATDLTEEGVVSITVANGSGTPSNAATFTVQDALLTGSSTAIANGAEGASSQLSNATFTDANPGDHSSDLSATIDWGVKDASGNEVITNGTIAYANGVYTVGGSNTYAEEGRYRLAITVTDSGGQTTTLTGTATVADAALTGSATATAAGTEGAAGSSVLNGATFTDANAGGHSGDFSATIDWGVKNSVGQEVITAGAITYSNGVYTVGGSNTYVEAGTYTLTIAVADAGGARTTLTGTATVGDAALAGSSTATAGGTEGATGSSVLSGATFTDANPGDHTGDFSAAIDWGVKDSRGNEVITAGAIGYRGGVYTVSGTNTYAEEGSYHLAITVTDTGGQQANITGIATVADAALTGSAAATAGGTEGATGSSVLSGATFTDANPGDHSAEFTAMIDWGVKGGSGNEIVTTGTIAYANGVYTVSGSNTYAEEGSYHLAMTITDTGGQATTLTGTAAVADAALTGSATATAGGIEGAVASSVLNGATFTDANPGDHTDDFSAAIDWGVKNSTGQEVISVGTIVYNNGVYTVGGTNTYAEDGTYRLRVTVTDVGGRSATLTGTATVGDAVLAGSATATAGGTERAFGSSALAGAIFTDANPGDHHADFSAVIDWGVKNSAGQEVTSAGTIAYANGVYTVSGSNTYAEEGTYNLTVTVTDAAGQSTTLTGKATIADAALTGSATATAGGTEGAAGSSVLSGATFTDANPGDHRADFSAVIDWGVKNSAGQEVTSAGTIAYANGVYTVCGSTTYDEAGAYHFRVTVTDAGGVSATLTGTATVADAALTGSATATAGGTEGAAGSSVLSGATFTDANPGNHLGDFHAVIDWGVKNSGGQEITSAGAIAYANGVYTVSGSNTYAGAGVYHLVITVSDTGGKSVVLSGTATVADAPLTNVANVAFTATEGLPFAGTVARFTDVYPSTDPTQYSATITWGDGASCAGTVAYAGTAGQFTVNASGKPHTYAEEGLQAQTFHVVIHHGALADTSTPSIAVRVNDAPLVDATTAQTVAAVSSRNTGTLTVATFIDRNPNAPATDYPASRVLIYWGDGTVSYGTVQLVSRSASGSVWRVVGSHTYTRSGTFRATVQVTDIGGQAVADSNTLFRVALGHLG